MEVPNGFQLEPNLKDVEGKHVDILAEVIFFCPGNHVCRSAIRGQTFRSDVMLSKGTCTFTMLDAKVQTIHNHMWVNNSIATKVIQHQQMTPSSLLRVIEACSGIGAMGQGFQACGMRTVCYIDLNERYCDWLDQQHEVPVVRGDVCDNQTIHKAAEESGGMATLAGGIACQPFSALGDRKEASDDRSRSAPGMLRMGYFMRAPLIILECTKEARESTWMQGLLRDFTEQTGYVLHQKILDLHSVWPSSRTRWWATLSHPALGISEIPPLPQLGFEPSILHLMQVQPGLSPEEMNQLVLDSYELRHFYCKPGGIHTSHINVMKKMPVATHSWGTQLGPCHCGCRKGGFSEERLRTRGLYGVLIPLNRTEKMGYDVVQSMRHPHPQEVAILNGLLPEYVRPGTTEHTKSLKFLLSGVGQLASPFQAAWVASNIIHQVHMNSCPIAHVEPKDIIAEIGLKLIHSRLNTWPNQQLNRYTDLFVLEFLTLHTDSNEALSRLNIDLKDILRTPTEVQCTDSEGLKAPVSTASLAGLMTTKVPIGHDSLAPRVHSCSLEPRVHSSEPLADKSCVHEVPPEHLNSAVQLGASARRSEVPVIAPCQTVPSECFATPVPKQIGNTDVIAPTHLDTADAEMPSTSTAILPGAPTVPISWKREAPPTETDPDAKRSRIEKPSTVDQLYNQGGGLLCFAANVLPKTTAHVEDRFRGDENATIPTMPQVSAETSPTDKADSPDNLPTIDTCEEDEASDPPGTPPTIDMLAPTECTGFVWVGIPGQTLIQQAFAGEPTVGQLILAEENIQGANESLKPLSAVGSEVSISTPIQGQQIVVIRSIDFQQAKCPCRSQDKLVPQLNNLTRVQALWHQLGWVAQDEIAFYLHNLETLRNVTITDPVVLKDMPTDSIVIGSWIMSIVEEAHRTSATHEGMTAFWFRSHWFPVAVKVSANDGTLHVRTTPSELSYVQVLLQETFGEDSVTFSSQVVADQFRADCGFQAVAWITKEALHRQTIVPIDSEAATNMRLKFEEHLYAIRQADEPCPELLLGGMPEVCQMPDIAKLVEMHGVQSHRSTQLTNHLVTQLGVPALKQVLQSPNPWKDLKNRCNTVKPPIQLVLTVELQAQIDARVKNGKQFGKKQGKIKKQYNATHQSKTTVQIRADQVQIPPGIFKQQDGQGLQQINIHDIQTKRRGVAVLSMTDAEPYFAIKEALTGEGLGLLIVHYDQEALPNAHTITSFPATCTDTGEPMILKAALVQLGQQAVCRSVPSNLVAVNEVETQVARCMVYRDQCQFDWTELCKKPAKTVMQSDAFQAIDMQGILDVWDRQFLSKSFQRARPDQAEIFTCTMRLTLPQAKILAESNAQHGLYIEPRVSNGRSPCPLSKVVWLPKRSFQEVVIAKNQTEVFTSIARSGDRYGLRASAGDIEKVHAQHRPEVEYLDASVMRQFKISPLPYGTTKASLQQVFNTWQWKARPSHTQGQSADFSGLAWVAYATENPQSWIYTMTHGDVLVTEITPKKPQVTTDVEHQIVASQKTLRHLSQPKHQDSKQDPWLKHDPWQQNTPQPMQVSQQQIARIEANVEKRVMTAMNGKQWPAHKAEDEAMESVYEDRIAALESKFGQMTENMNTLSTNVAGFQQSQQRHNQQVAQEIQNTQKRLEDQASRVEIVLDKKLESQMEKIEALLSRRMTHE